MTVISDRAGLVMNPPDARVKMRGVQVGKVESIESRADGTAALHLAMDPAELRKIPSNVVADIASTTVFGAKYVNFEPPTDPSPKPMYAGQVLQGQHVTVEINTVFQQLNQVLNKIDPTQLNATLGALSKAFAGGRGKQFGQTVADFDQLLAKLEPSLPNMAKDIELTAPVAAAYADAAPDLVKTVQNTNRISQSIVDEQQNLDTFLVNMIGLADQGNEVLGTNQPALSKVLHLLTPTTALFNEYAPVIPPARSKPWTGFGCRRHCRTPPAWPWLLPSHWASIGTATRRTCPRWRPRAARNAWACRTSDSATRPSTS